MAVVTFACASLAAVPVRQALAHGTDIGPRQYFTAAVNGSQGRQAPVTIRMACFGPVRPGQTGHPFGGQTVSVHHIARTAVPEGYTGNRGTSIGAFFGAPPPGAAAASSPSYIAFSEYGRKPIPTSMELPCSGSGDVTFVALPLDPSARGVTVPVSYVGQP